MIEFDTTQVIPWLQSNVLTIDFAIQSFILATGIIGQHFIAKREAKAFYVWFASNIALIYVNWNDHHWGGCILYAYFSYMCIYSISKWKVIETAGRQEQG